jgi:hypothetical protein
MVTERQEEPQKAFERRRDLQQQYGVQRFFEGFSKKVSSSVEELLDRSYENWTVHAPWTVPCRFHSDRSGLEIFEIFWTRGKALSRGESNPIRLEARPREVRMLLSGARDGADHLGREIFGDWV